MGKLRSVMSAGIGRRKADVNLPRGFQPGQVGDPCPHCGFETGTDDCTCYGLAGTPEGREQIMDEGLYLDSPSVAHNRFSSLSLETQSKIASMGLLRVAGNVYECPSTKDFWQVAGGKIMRLSGDVVDNGESIQAAPQDKPMEFLSSILDDLSF